MAAGPPQEEGRWLKSIRTYWITWASSIPSPHRNGTRNEFCGLLEISTTGTWRIALAGEWEEGEAVLNIKFRGS
jgi:hypothetical protein